MTQTPDEAITNLRAKICQEEKEGGFFNGSAVAYYKAGSNRRTRDSSKNFINSAVPHLSVLDSAG
jgi:hypothetical protein